MEKIVVRDRARTNSSRKPQQLEPHLPLWHRIIHLLNHRRDFQEVKGCYFLG